jgi:hypothetical protein
MEINKKKQQAKGKKLSKVDEHLLAEECPMARYCDSNTLVIWWTFFKITTTTSGSVRQSHRKSNFLLKFSLQEEGK